MAVGRRDRVNNQVVMDINPLNFHTTERRAVGVLHRDIELPAHPQPRAFITGDSVRFQPHADERILYRGATSRGDDSGRAGAESDALDQVAGGPRATHLGVGRNDRPPCHHVPGGTDPRGACLIGLNGQSGLDTVMAYQLIVVGIPAERRRAVVEGMMLTAGEAGMCEEPAVHSTVGHRVLTHPSVRVQDVDVLAKVSGPVGGG
jgi:hypothetical protein